MLASLLSAGTVPAVPKFASAAVSRHLKARAPPGQAKRPAPSDASPPAAQSYTAAYAELEKAFAERSAEALAKALAAHGEAYRADGNLGLAKQLAAALPGRGVARLTSTYLTLPLADIAAAAGLAGAAEAEARVLRMVADGDIFATIDARAGVVAFSEEPGAFDTRRVAQRLQRCVDGVVALSQRLRALDEALAAEPAYVARVVQAERNAAAVPDAAAGTGPGGALGRGWGAGAGGAYWNGVGMVANGRAPTLKFSTPACTKPAR